MEPNDFDKPLYVRDPGLRYRKERLIGAFNKYKFSIEWSAKRVKKTWGLIKAAMEDIEKASIEIDERTDRCHEKFEEELHRFEAEIPAAIARDERRLKAIKNRLERECASLKRQLALHESQPTKQEANPHNVSRAKSLAVFDSILFAIENWSTDGQVASDCILAFQATLFPLVYMPIMKGNTDYYLDEVPPSALEVVKRGREFIQFIREVQPKSLIDPEVWDEMEPLLREWMINDGLPLIYGAKDEDWDAIPTFTQSMMLQWRDQPASRALDFPLIWDGMELVKEHADEIRNDSGLPEFNKQQITTRIEP
jgi:hypothetical protein